jgi:hypothetical protein
VNMVPGLQGWSVSILLFSELNEPTQLTHRQWSPGSEMDQGLQGSVAGIMYTASSISATILQVSD